MKWFKSLTWPNKLGLIAAVIVGLALLFSSGKQPATTAGGSAPSAGTSATAPSPAPAAAPAAPTAPAAPPAPQFTARDLATIMQTSQTNEARFDRDYKGKRLTAAGTFDSMEESLGSQSVTLNVGDFQVVCNANIGDRRLGAKAIDWHSGDRLTITGKIDYTFVGTFFYLDDCDVNK